MREAVEKTETVRSNAQRRVVIRSHKAPDASQAIRRLEKTAD